MSLSEYARHLLAIAQTIYRWAGQISALDAARREKVALYAEEIAATLARAAQAFIVLDAQPTEKTYLLSASRELGRIAGYLDTIVAALAHHLDGRKSRNIRRSLYNYYNSIHYVKFCLPRRGTVGQSFRQIPTALNVRCSGTRKSTLWAPYHGQLRHRTALLKHR